MANLLEETYPLWDWQASNGQATALQTSLAYNAITNGGLCIDFSKLVWNDIVDSTNKLLIAIGKQWDNKYLSVANSKIPNDGILTAAMFNSVRHNIEQAMFTTWAWEFDYTRIGHVGRNDFRGVSQTNIPDNVYGWYIAELVRKFNICVEVFRGTYDVTELTYVNASNTNVAAALPIDFSIKLKPTVADNSVTNVESLLKAIPLISLPSFTKESETTLITNFYARESIKLGAINKSSLMIVSELDKIPSIPMRRIYNSESNLIFDMPVAQAKNMEGVYISESQLETRLIVSAWLNRMKAVSNAITNVKASLDRKDSIVMASVENSLSYCMLRLTAKDMLEINDSEEVVASKVKAELVRLNPAVFSTQLLSESNVVSTIVKIEPAVAQMNLESATKVNCMFVALPFDSHTIIEEAASYNKALLFALERILLQDTIKSASSANVILAVTKSEYITIIEASKSNDKSALITINPEYIDVSIESNSFIISEIKNISSFPISIKGLGTSSLVSMLRYSSPTLLLAFDKSISENVCSLITRPPLSVGAVNVSNSYESGKVECLLPTRIPGAVNKTNTVCVSKIGMVEVQNVSYIENSHTNCIAQLDSLWESPTFVGDGLWFRQLYDYVYDEENGILEVI